MTILTQKEAIKIASQEGTAILRAFIDGQLFNEATVNLYIYSSPYDDLPDNTKYYAIAINHPWSDEYLYYADANSTDPFGEFGPKYKVEFFID